MEQYVPHKKRTLLVENDVFLFCLSMLGVEYYCSCRAAFSILTFFGLLLLSPLRHADTIHVFLISFSGVQWAGHLTARGHTLGFRRRLGFPFPRQRYVL